MAIEGWNVPKNHIALARRVGVAFAPSELVFAFERHPSPGTRLPKIFAVHIPMDIARQFVQTIEMLRKEQRPDWLAEH